MEAWLQYKEFTPRQQPEPKEGLPPSTPVSPLIATAASPFAATATTLRGDLTDVEKSKTGNHLHDDASPPFNPANTLPPPVVGPKEEANHSRDPNQNPSSQSEPKYVAFLPSDPMDPQNWSSAYKARVVSLLTFLTLSLTFASSASSAAETGVMAEFGCGQVAATATTGVFLLGMGIGAMPSAPLSERTSSNALSLSAILLPFSITQRFKDRCPPSVWPITSLHHHHRLCHSFRTRLGPFSKYHSSHHPPLHRRPCFKCTALQRRRDAE